ncbi:hypothetical protein [Caproiciproducens sp. LBM24188]|nr:hypothetical protein [Oscillospiraceae bacterium]HHV30987.1 hypothetical protein [Clostridiales bacterium]
MDYYEWGMQYLGEAQSLKERLLLLRRKVRECDNETALKLCRRISMLNEMYLECLHTGKYLIEYGGSHEEKIKSQS